MNADLSRTDLPQIKIAIPNLGKMVVGTERASGGETTMRVSSIEHTCIIDGRFSQLPRSVVQFEEPPGEKPPAMRQYVIDKQQIVILTEDQIGRLRNGTVRIEAVARRDPDRTRKSTRLDKNVLSITVGDCSNPVEDGKEPTYIVLLEWKEDTSLTDRFPQLAFFDENGELIMFIGPDEQTPNFLVSADTGTNEPPVRPPVTTATPLNGQPCDYKTLTAADLEQYRRYQGRFSGPAVAVLDTGLKFNLQNLGERPHDDPYVYRDANGQERRFILAYQEQPIPGCEAMTDNHLGYCAIQSYRQAPHVGATSTTADVLNSPYDDFRLFDETNPRRIRDARHGTSIAAIIQQCGSDAPILPVKAFDNVGFATLFDVLNAFNYILHRRVIDDIRVVNISWIHSRDEPLLRQKISQLMQAGVFVVAAAGNRGQTSSPSLDEAPVYPACYSEELPNVITVTSVQKLFAVRPGRLQLPADPIEHVLTEAINRAGSVDSADGAGSVERHVKAQPHYEAAENYSKKFVNVGVVSQSGYFQSPFWDSVPLRGSSFACGFVSGFVARQLRQRPDLLPSGPVYSNNDMKDARQQLLDAMSGKDRVLASKYVAQGYYLSGYAAPVATVRDDH